MTYKKKKRKKRNFLQRLFGISKKSNAYVDINNLIHSKGILAISEEDLSKIFDRYNINRSALDDESIIELLIPFYVRAFSDLVFSEGEEREISHLQYVLNLPDELLNKAQLRVVVPLYQQAVEEAISDGELSEEELNELNTLSSQLQITDSHAQEIINEAKKSFAQAQFDEMIKDEMVSPDEAERWDSLETKLNIELNLDDKSEQLLALFQRYWQLRRGALNPIRTEFNLYKSENCYGSLPVVWNEWKTETRRINYGGPTARIRIAKGLYWSTGSVGIKRQKSDVLKAIDSGQLLLTNKRLLFVGSRNTKQIRLNRILDFELFSNGIQIKKDAGKHPFIEVDADHSEFGILLDRLISEY